MKLQNRRDDGPPQKADETPKPDGTTTNLVVVPPLPPTPPAPVYRQMWVWVTQELAAKWLDSAANKAKNNRALMETYLRRLIPQFEEGFWKDTHQGIGFYLDGAIADGQHRLEAIRRAKSLPYGGIWFWATYDLPNDVSAVLDTGQSRRIAQALDIMLNRRMDARIAQIAMRLCGGFKKYQQPLIVADFVQKHEEALNFVVDLFKSKKRGIGQVAVLAVFVRAYYHATKQELAQFAQVLHDNQVHEVRDNWATMLRMHIEDKLRSSQRGADLRLTIYSRTEQALSNFINQKPSKGQLREAREELFLFAGESKNTPINFE